MAYQRLNICSILLPRNNRLTIHLGHKSIEAHNLAIHHTAIFFRKCVIHIDNRILVINNGL